MKLNEKEIMALIGCFQNFNTCGEFCSLFLSERMGWRVYANSILSFYYDLAFGILRSQAR